MAGNVKVGGNVIATHTGVEGAGTVTLSNVTASAIKMSSSGNTITDSAGNAVLSESSGTVNINKGTLGSAVNINTPLASATFPGKIIKNVYVDYSGSDTGLTSSTTNKVVYSVTIPNPQTSYSYLIIGGIGGYIDSGSEYVIGSLIKDHNTAGETYIKDNMVRHYHNSLDYNDLSFFDPLHYYYEPSTSTSFTIDAAVRSDGSQVYRSPWVWQNPFMVLELGGN